MFTCPKCLRRAIQGLSSDLSINTTSSWNFRSIHPLISSPVEALRTTHNGHVIVRHVQRRPAATMASLRKGHHRRIAKKTFENKTDASEIYNKRRRAPLALTAVELRDALARAKNRALRNRSNEDDDDEDVEADDAEDGDEDVRPSQANEKAVETSQLIEKIKSKTAKTEQAKMAKLKRDVETYYKDPLQLATAVVEKLRVPDIDGALGLVRASESLKINNVVSWNHCMDWLMSQGEYKTALKIYNEMKKRGHMPDAHTYTIMLSGLAQHAKNAMAVQEAVKMYNSMSAPNSVVKPNIIHTNAIINVCARGGDMETLWAVASKLPERGPGCPDRTTYTTILNALRENTVRKAAGIADRANRQVEVESPSQERLGLFKDALDNGRKLWVDIDNRWRRADMIIDEQLVCAMGRLILGCGTGNDIEQVFDLVDTTMNVRLSECRGRGQQPWLIERSENADPGKKSQESSSDAHKLPLKESSVYAIPGRNTLSMLLEAALLYKQRGNLGKLYWHLLTKPDGRFRVQPDAGNILSYLRVLRRTHSSHDVYQILSKSWPDEVAKSLYKRSTFIIAFAACARDKNNPNVFETARKLLALCNNRLEEKAVGMFEESIEVGNMDFEQRKKFLQQQRVEVKSMNEDELADYHRSKDGILSLTTDPKILRYFIELAVDTTKGWNEGIRGLDDGSVFERSQSKNNTLIALDTIGPSLPMLYQLIGSKLDEIQFGATTKFRKQTGRRDGSSVGEKSQVGESIEEIVALSRSMIAAYDKVLVIADRFERQKKDPIDSKRCASYDRNKRHLHAHMARIEATLRQRLREKSTASDTKDLDKAADDDDENQVPDIERRIRAVIEGVDGTWAGPSAGTQSKETKKFGIKKESQTPRRIGGVSIKQKKARLALIEAGMKRQFGDQFSRTASNDSTITEQRQNMSKPQQTELKKSSKRLPMIGDELGLDDEEDDDLDHDFLATHEAKSSIGSGQAKRRYVPFESSNQSMSKSIVQNEQVKNEWGKAYAAASAQ